MFIMASAGMQSASVKERKVRAQFLGTHRDMEHVQFARWDLPDQASAYRVVGASGRHQDILRAHTGTEVSIPPSSQVNRSCKTAGRLPPSETLKELASVTTVSALVVRARDQGGERTVQRCLALVAPALRYPSMDRGGSPSYVAEAKQEQTRPRGKERHEMSCRHNQPTKSPQPGGK
jgi:hypothetical protein